MNLFIGFGRLEGEDAYHETYISNEPWCCEDGLGVGEFSEDEGGFSEKVSGCVQGPKLTS